MSGSDGARGRFRICTIGEMPLASVRRVEVAGHAPIAVYHLPDGYFATDDRCTHGEASLAEGEIDGDEIVCPFHLGKFDIRTGEATAAPCVEALTCHRLVIEDDSLYLLAMED